MTCRAWRWRSVKSAMLSLTVLTCLVVLVGLGFLGDWLRPLFEKWLGWLVGYGLADGLMGGAVFVALICLVALWVFCFRKMRRSQTH
jgi:hypothetical protein